MPGGRKGRAILNKSVAIDPAYEDLNAKLEPIPGSGEYRSYTNQEEQIDAVGGPPQGVMQDVMNTGGMPQYTPEDIFAKPSEFPEQSGLMDSSQQQTVQLGPDTNTQILIKLIKEKSNIAKLRF